MTITRATAADLPALSALMRAFYAEEHLAFGAQTERAIAELTGDTNLGGAYLLRDGGGVKGYFVLTFGFSIERGGKTSLLDELYVVPDSRGRGFGKAAVAEASAIARASGCATLHLEVDHANKKARALYERAGFVELTRNYLVRTL